MCRRHNLIIAKQPVFDILYVFSNLVTSPVNRAPWAPDQVNEPINSNPFVY